jgi:hypothetical protein
MTRHRAALLCAVLLCAPRAALLGQASPYLYLHHPAYAEIDLLIERGVLRGLSPVVRPYRRGDIARALLHADTSRASRAERGWLARLRRELRPELDAIQPGASGERTRVAAEAAVNVTGRTNAHRDLLRPSPAHPGRSDVAGEFDLRAAFPGVAVESHLRADSYYWHDPQVPVRVTSNTFRERAEDAYLELQGRHARFLVGRLYRNWAPTRVPGTQLSDYAYSFDQAALWAGTEKLNLSLIAARLDDYPSDVRRYLALHRIDWQPTPDLALYVAEGVLYAGPGRDFELEFLNPVSFWFHENTNQTSYRGVTNNNSQLAVGFWWRPRPSLIAYADFMLDDIRLNAGAPNGFRYAFYGGLVFPRLARAAVGRVGYAQVSSLAYRTFADFERYTFRELGLGWDIADAELYTAEVDFFPTAALRAGPRLALLRRGEGDFRQPFPANFDSLPRVLTGVVETTLRVAVAGGWRLGPVLSVDWDAGPNFVANRGHVRDRSLTQFEGRLTLRAALGRAGSLE